MQETEAQVKYTKPPLKDTALHLASRRKDNELVKLFIEAGAGVDVQNVRIFNFFTLKLISRKKYYVLYAMYFIIISISRIFSR